MLLQQGGSGPFSSHCLTKTLLIGCDMTLGRRSHVPAFSKLFTSCPMRCFLQLSRVDVRHRRHVNSLFKQYTCAGPFTLRFPHHAGNHVPESSAFHREFS